MKKNLDILSEVEKVMSEGKATAKIVNEETMHTMQEIWLELENKSDSDGPIYMDGVYIIIHRDSKNEVTSVIVEGAHSLEAWDDIMKYVKGLK